MKTFKVINVGDETYFLSFHYFEKPHPKTLYKHYLRITGGQGREFILTIRFSYEGNSYSWEITTRNSASSFMDRTVIRIGEKHKAQEVRRQIMKFLTQS